MDRRETETAGCSRFLPQASRTTTKPPWAPPSANEPPLRQLSIRISSLPSRSKARRVTSLPRHADWHWRGIWNQTTQKVLGPYFPKDQLLEETHSARSGKDFVNDWTLCHNKPLKPAEGVLRGDSRYPDIPDRLDVYLLVASQFSSFAFSGDKQGAVIRCTPATAETIQRLRDWESDATKGRYRRTRGRAQLQKRRGRSPSSLEIEHQFARSALRAAGLVWPRNPRERAKKWPECLRQLGLHVELFDTSRFWLRCDGYGIPREK